MYVAVADMSAGDSVRVCCCRRYTTSYSFKKECLARRCSFTKLRVCSGGTCPSLRPLSACATPPPHTHTRISRAAPLRWS